ncbi:MAG: hypothetical protein K2R98_32010 [Gemmataceae bacterium]|nr:hypothetical protein [Gemmataceae bacterium]
MAKSQENKPSTQEVKQGVENNEKGQRLSDAIGKCVMRTLGHPNDLQRVQVRRLWDDRYRVNVVVGIDAASARIPHSFFLVVDGDGNIVASTPKIIKAY